MRKILFLVLLLFQSQTAHAQSRWYRMVDWKEVSIDADTSRFADIDSSVTEVWVRWRWTKPHKVGKLPVFTSELDKIRFTCDPQRLRNMREVNYGKSGDVVGGSDEASDWEEPVPDSIGEELVTNLCVERGWLRWTRSHPDTTKRKE